ncbi:MAG: PQ-loop domain-containing transporter [Nanoarchaeota archaeon]
MITDIVGYVAAIMGTLIMFPQLIKTIRTKSAKDVSMGMLIVFLINCFLWVT